MTRFSGLRRGFGLAVAVTAVAATIGCGGEAQPPGGATQWVSPAESGAPAASSKRLAKVTAACKLLPAKKLVDILGGSSGAGLTGTEEPVENLAAGKRRYACSYGRDGNEPFALLVSIRPGQADNAKASVDAMAEAAEGKTTRFTVGEVDGVGYAKDDFRVVALALPYETELRLVIFTAPKLVPHAKLVEIAQHVVPQL